MSIEFRLARTADELDETYRVRHRVFMEQEKCFVPREDGRFFDRFDTYPATVNFVAISDGKVLGALRATEDSEAGLPSDAVYDFRKRLDSPGLKFTSCSMLCVPKEARGNPSLVIGLFLMGFYWCAARGADYILAPMNPQIGKKMFSIGFEAVDEEFPLKGTDLRILPLAIEVKRANDFFLDFVKTQKMLPYLENFKRALYFENEAVIRAGDVGQAAYVIVDGKVNVTLGTPGSPEEKIIAELGPGEMFGELALLTDARRTANVVAQTDTNLMVLEREEFHKQVVNDPQKCLDLLQVIGRRLRDTLERCGAA